jgi:protoporphyrin/coproporphyrin ferrochelatase
MPIGVLVIAYGTASGPDDIERYYTDIRGGRAPTPEHLAELKERYAAIGNRFPLLEITTQQADGLVRVLNASANDGSTFRAYLGMKHSPPFVADTVAQMHADGIERAVGIVMAPHWSGMSIQTYIDRVLAAAGDGPPSFAFVRSFHDHPMFIAFLAGRVAHALGTLMPAEREKSAIVFSAHSLPVRTEDDGSHRCKLCTAEACATGCTYRGELQRTAQLVAAELDLHQEVTTGWQSAGRTADPWWGPPLEDVIQQLASAGHPAVVVCSAGFVSDHLEILYDLDIEAQALAAEARIHLVRTEMPNADPAFVEMLATVVREQLDA